jgi:RNA-dependent RNA polymerase
VKQSLDLQLKSSENQDATSLGNILMLSFPWIAVDYLARTKIRNRKVGNFDSTKAVGSLAKYLSERL